jgi:hypothetical protein
LPSFQGRWRRRVDPWGRRRWRQNCKLIAAMIEGTGNWRCRHMYDSYQEKSTHTNWPYHSLWNLNITMKADSTRCQFLGRGRPSTPELTSVLWVVLSCAPWFMRNFMLHYNCFWRQPTLMTCKHWRGWIIWWINVISIGNDHVGHPFSWAHREMLRQKQEVQLANKSDFYNFLR